MTIAERLGLKTKPIFLMDGSAFIYRGFYANRYLRRSDGFPTNAIFIVARTLMSILRRERPDYFLFTVDGPGPNFRRQIFGEYKANRDKMPEDLAVQLEPVNSITRALGIKIEISQNCEADDCIASLAARFSDRKPVVIISGDKDLKQCLGPNVFMWDPGSKEDRIFTAQDLFEESGVTPAQWPDMQAIIGDSSDNIPGVPGIGPKTARQIFAICSSLEDIEQHFALLPPKLQAKLQPHLAEMFKWRELTTLRRDVCTNLKLSDLAVTDIDAQLCGKLIEEYELNSLVRNIAAIASNRQKGREEEEAVEQEIKTIENIAEPTARKIAKAADLPDCKGRTVAVIWPEAASFTQRLALADSDQAEEYEWQGSMEELCAWLAAAGEIIVADLKFLLTSYPAWRELAAGRKFFDLGLASWLLNPEESDHTWRKLALRWREALKCMDKGPAVLAIQMHRALKNNLEKNGLLELYTGLELPLVPVLAEMERQGIAIDPEAFREFLQEVEKDMEKWSNRVFELAGETFNLRSSQQLADVLFNKLKLGESAKTRGGKPSTSQLALEKLAASSPVVESVLQFRKLDKMRSTYLDPLPRLMDANNRIHTTFNQEATATGRLSSSNPNLQNIPVRGGQGQRMRACFVAGAGNMLISADYSQIELRILAYLSQDANLVEAFRNGEDIHTRTAALVFDCPQEDITADQRRMAKTINFGLLYGMGAQKLAQELKITVPDAKNFIQRYFARLSTLRDFYDRIVENARLNGYVETMAGRKRWLPDIHSVNNQTAAQAQRQAINTVIQGSAADVIKMAMLAVANDQWLAGTGARLVLQVHDELLLEAPKAVAWDVGQHVADLMAGVRPGGQELPLRADWGVGSNWGEAH